MQNFIRTEKTSTILNSFIPRPRLESWLIIWHTNFEICGGNPMILPYKWNLFVRIFAQQYLVFVILLVSFGKFFFGHYLY